MSKIARFPGIFLKKTTSWNWNQQPLEDGCGEGPPCWSQGARQRMWRPQWGKYWDHFTYLYIYIYYIYIYILYIYIYFGCGYTGLDMSYEIFGLVEVKWFQFLQILLGRCSTFIPCWIDLTILPWADCLLGEEKRGANEPSRESTAGTSKHPTDWHSVVV